MSSLPARMKKIKLKMKVLDCSQDFFHYKYMGIFPDAQGQLTLQSTVRSGQISNLSKTLWLSSLPAKNEEDPIKYRGARVFTTLYINFSDVQGLITLVCVVVFGRNSNSSKLSCMSLPARMRLVKLKMKELECSQHFSHDKSRGTRVFTTLYIIFSDAQGQITLELIVVYGRNLFSFKVSCMSSLPARMRIIDSKMKELQCSQDYSHYKYMGIFFQTLKGS